MVQPPLPLRVAVRDREVSRGDVGLPFTMSSLRLGHE